MALRENTTVAMTGLEIPYEIPADTSELSIQAMGGDVLLAWSSGGNTRTIEEGDVKEYEDPNLGGKTLYLTGLVGVSAEIEHATGISA